MKRSDDAHCLLAVDGFVVLAASEEEGECFVLVETTSNRAGCPECGVIATGHGRSVVQVRDLPSGGRPVRRVWRKHRWICREQDCPRRTFIEQSQFIEGTLSAAPRSRSAREGRARRPGRRPRRVRARHLLRICDGGRAPPCRAPRR